MLGGAPHPEAGGLALSRPLQEREQDPALGRIQDFGPAFRHEATTFFCRSSGSALISGVCFLNHPACSK
jgi:hypothetical protein